VVSRPKKPKKIYAAQSSDLNRESGGESQHDLQHVHSGLMDVAAKKVISAIYLKLSSNPVFVGLEVIVYRTREYLQTLHGYQSISDSYKTFPVLLIQNLLKLGYSVGRIH
jgi:hypothetical protein